MDQDQEDISLLYGWTSVFVTTAVLAILFIRIVMGLGRNSILRPVLPEGKPGEEAFSDINIFGYIPQVRIDGLPFPYLLCDDRKLDYHLIGWYDPYKDNHVHSLLFYMPELLKKKYLFSEVRHWPPPTQQSNCDLHYEILNNIDIDGYIFGDNLLATNELSYDGKRYSTSEWQINLFSSVEFAVERTFAFADKNVMHLN